MTKKTVTTAKARPGSGKSKPTAAKPVKKTVAKAPPKKTAKPAPKKAAAPAAKPKATAATKEVVKKAVKTAAKPVKAAPQPTAAPARRPTLKVIEPIRAVRMPTRPVRGHRISGKPVRLPEGYVPTETEEYMSPVMLEYFRHKLTVWKQELLRESSATLDDMRELGGMQEPDIADRATLEIDRSLELRARDRERKLISKIDEALGRIQDGSYGFCEETGDPIGVKRLEARPVATLSVEAQERHERKERARREEVE